MTRTLSARGGETPLGLLPDFTTPNGVWRAGRREDGNLHDYYFPLPDQPGRFYGCPARQGSLIMDRMLAKMKEVGYTHFRIRLPET